MPPMSPPGEDAPEPFSDGRRFMAQRFPERGFEGGEYRNGAWTPELPCCGGDRFLPSPEVPLGWICGQLQRLWPEAAPRREAASGFGAGRGGARS